MSKRFWSALVILIQVPTLVFAAPKSLSELKEEVCQILPSLYGWCSSEKAMNFMDLVCQEKPDVCVEIGVFGGSSLYPVASALKFLDHGTVIAIDPWDKLECLRYLNPITDAQDFTWWLQIDFDHIYDSFRQMLYQNALESYCQIVRLKSSEAISEIDSIDILYLDGNHDPEQFLEDAMLYFPKVKTNGYIWVNDALSLKIEPTLKYLFDYCSIVKFIDNNNCILLKKL